MKKFIALLVFLPCLASLTARAYYGGQTLNHGHTSAAGDGGPLSNPVVSGTGTFVGANITTLNVTGLATINRQVVTQSTITNLTATNFNTSTLTLTALSVVSSTATKYSAPILTGSRLLNAIDPQYSFSGTSTAPRTGFYGFDDGSTREVGFVQGGLATFRCQTGDCFSFKPFTITGYADGSSAAGGMVGEFISSVSASGTPFPTTNQWGNSLAITLTAGDWDVSGILWTSAGAGAVVAQTILAVGTVTGNDSTGTIQGDNYVMCDLPVNGVRSGGGAIPPWRTSLSGSQTYYLKVLGEFSGGACTYKGRISARRVR